MEALLLAVSQVIVGIALAPLLFGITRKTKARLQYRRGPSVLQPYRDLAKWWAKDPVESDAASPLTAAVPVIVLAAMLVAVLLVPLVARTPALPGPADILVVIGLLALVRFALALGALDAGGAFGGMGASREVAIASLVEPGLMLALAVGIAAAGTTDLATIAGSGTLLGGAGLTPGLALGAAAFAIVAVAETGHEPVDNPDTHLELTMIHEGMILEASGRRLGALMLASWLKLVVVVGLFSAVFLPAGMADELTPVALLAGMAAAAVKLVIAAVALALLDASLAKLRILQLPSLLGVASILGVTALAAQLWLAA
jgi:formate hydrogenlyase subunit 4